MSRILHSVQWGCLGVLGAALCYWSTRLSVLYNAWTTSFRERHPHINPPPTPDARNSNTKIMNWLFRILGASLFLLAIVVLLLDIRNSR
jgi:hypothetical protein